MKDLLKKAIAEVIGTFVLVFAACGAAAFLNNSVGAAFAFGLVIVAMAYSIGRVSGCHINPAVSLGCLLTKRMTLKEFGVYVLAQVLGGFVGAVALFGICKMGGFAFEGKDAIGDACNAIIGGFANGFTVGGTIGALLVEVILTCVFVYVILNVTSSKNESAGKKAGIIIGLTLTLVHLIGIGLTGTSVNPARSLATALGSLIFFGSTDALAQVWVFIVGPLVGGLLAALLFKFIHKED